MKGLNRLRNNRHTISGAFIFLLLGTFAVFSTLMVLFSAQFYRATVEQTRWHNDQRILYNYVMNTVRGNDAEGSVSVRREGDIPVLALGWDVDGERYETSVYYYEGAVRELFAEAGEPFDPEYGEVICAAQAMVPELTGGLLTLRLTDSRGNTDTVHMALRCEEAGV